MREEIHEQAFSRGTHLTPVQLETVPLDHDGTTIQTEKAHERETQGSNGEARKPNLLRLL